MSEQDLEVFETVLRACSGFGVDSSNSAEAEEYIARLVEDYEGGVDGLSEWLSPRIAEHFPAVVARPRWLQGAEWPFAKGRPMVFAGQLDIPVRRGDAASRYFHDDTSFYVFVASGAEPVTVMQQM